MLANVASALAPSNALTTAPIIAGLHASAPSNDLTTAPSPADLQASVAAAVDAEHFDPDFEQEDFEAEWDLGEGNQTDDGE